MTQPTTTSTASKTTRPQEERNIEFPRYVKAILVACAITISLNFTIVNPFVYHHQRQIYPSKDDSTIASVAAATSTSSTVITSVLSVSNPDGDDHHGDSDRNEDGNTRRTDDNDDNDDTYPAAGEDDENDQNTSSNVDDDNDNDDNDDTKEKSNDDTSDTSNQGKNDIDQKDPTNDGGDDDNNNVRKDESQGGGGKGKGGGKTKSIKDDDDRMNILILYPDDWRHDSIGSEKPYVLTPILNQLANEGIRFTHNAVTSSICWMSRATLFMGQYTSRHQSYKLKCPMFATRENWKHSWVSMLKNAGYFLGHIGKWQYHHSPEKQPTGFDFNDLFEGKHWYPRNGKMIHGSNLARDAAFRFLKERPKDKPFALSIAFYPPKPIGVSHEPGRQWEPKNETRVLYNNVTIPEPGNMNTNDKVPKFLKEALSSKSRYYERYRTEEHFQASMKNYYALITGVDRAIGEIIDSLKKEDLYKNTMIIFTTDNGMFHGAHGFGGKWYPYQESIRVPLIIYDPRMPPEKVGTLDDSLTLNVDLAETILGAAGLKPDDLMQGRDMSDLYLPNVKNEFHNTASVKSEPWRDDFFYEFPYWDTYIPASTALVNKEWKYIHWTYQNYEQLFNLKDDPLEMNDLYNNTESQSMLEIMKKRYGELKGIYHNETYMEHPCIDDSQKGWKYSHDLS